MNERYAQLALTSSFTLVSPISTTFVSATVGTLPSAGGAYLFSFSALRSSKKDREEKAYVAVNTGPAGKFERNGALPLSTIWICW